MQSCRFLLLALPGCLLASVSMASAPQRPAPAITPAAISTGLDGFGPSAAEASLATMRGGTDVVENMNLHGTVDNNSADHVATGYNTIADGAFTGAVGVPMVIQNSGNNVLIQNATIINVQFQP